MPVLVDTNLLLDVATEDLLWFDWSTSRLSQAANRDGLAINPIVYAESAEATQHTLRRLGFAQVRS